MSVPEELRALMARKADMEQELQVDAAMRRPLPLRSFAVEGPNPDTPSRNRFSFSKDIFGVSSSNSSPPRSTRSTSLSQACLA